MKKQRAQVIALVFLLIFWAVLWRFFIRVRPVQPPAAKPAATAKMTPSESLLKTRFRRVRAEMDALYHYRIKPVPFDAQWNPFRIAGEPEVPEAKSAPKAPEASQAPVVPDYSESLLKSAISNIRVGGVVNLHGSIQLTLGGQLHREGDVITANIQTAKNEWKPIRIKIRHLSEATVVFGFEDPEAGSAEYTVNLKEERR